jgi:hypothetical protein
MIMMDAFTAWADAADYAKWLHRHNASLLRYPFKTGVFHRDFFKAWKISFKIGGAST